jgi:hypothetical protein
VPLVDHAQAVHQDLLGREQLGGVAVVVDGLRVEVERAALPAQHVEDRVARDEVARFAHRAFGEPVARDERMRERLRRRARGRERLVGALARQEATADQPVRDRIELVARADARRHDEPAVERELRARGAVAQLEHAGLALLADQLEDVGDAEVGELAREARGHYSCLRAASELPTAIT